MNRTSIEWIFNPDGSRPGWSWNPLTGCLNKCSYCYARKLANGRLKQRYLANTNLAPGAKGGVATLSISGKAATEREGAYADPFYPRFWEERLDAPIEHPTPMNPAKRKGIFVCDMGELFGDWILQEWQDWIFTTIKLCPYHRFYLLTKQPQNLIKWSPFPENCWVGVTATNRKMFCEAIRDLKEIKATVKYISIEPCLERVISNDGWICEGAENVPLDDAFMLNLAHVDWLIIGAQTKPYKPPKVEWVREIELAAKQSNIPVFEKDNLRPLLKRDLVQELPR